MAASDEGADGAERAAPDVTALAGLAPVEQQLERIVQDGRTQLDYSHWRWYPGASVGDGRPRWRLVPDGRAAGSAQSRSGWQWSAAGWVQRAARKEHGSIHQPPAEVCSAASSATSARDLTQRGQKDERRPRERGAAEETAEENCGRLHRNKRRALEARVSSVGGCWWRRP